MAGFLRHGVFMRYRQVLLSIRTGGYALWRSGIPPAWVCGCVCGWRGLWVSTVRQMKLRKPTLQNQSPWNQSLQTSPCHGRPKCSLTDKGGLDWGCEGVENKTRFLSVHRPSHPATRYWRSQPYAGAGVSVARNLELMSTTRAAL